MWMQLFIHALDSVENHTKESYSYLIMQFLYKKTLPNMK